MESLYVELYQKRCIFDCTAQPKFTNHYLEVDNDLRRYSMKNDYHPYEIRPDVSFTSNHCYINGDTTWYSGILPRKTKYLYRIDNLYKLLFWNRLNVANKFNLRKKYRVRKFNGSLVDQSEIPLLFNSIESSTKTWLPLSDLLLKYETPRQMTWWTNHNVMVDKEPNKLMDSAHKLGLATNWINNYSVVIRCNLYKFSELKPIDNFKVPSVIDAYNSPIFLPQLQINKPKFGITINLRNIGTIGLKEYTIRKIPLDCLEFQLIKISDDIKIANSSAAECEDLYKKIISLY